MKVLILHQHFRLPQQGGALRSYYLSKALVERHIEAVVITAHNEPKYRKTMVEGIEIHYLPVAYDNRFGFYRRVRAFLQFMMKAVRLASAHRDARLCYAISTPLTAGLAAVIIHRRLRIPYIFEVGDLWPDAPIQMGFVKNSFLKYMLYRMEGAIYRRAASIVALSPPILNAVSKKIPGKLIHMLPNMSDTEFFLPASKNPDLMRKFYVKHDFVISYIGAIGRANGLHYYLQCAETCQRKGLPIHFLLCGDGAMLDEMKAFARNHSLTNLTIIPFQNRDGVAEVMNVTDATFICYEPVKILETGSPNKYFDGLAAGKMIIVNFGGWIREEISREGCGMYVDPGAVDDFEMKIVPFLTDRTLLKQAQCAARRLGERRYSRQLLGEKYHALVKEAASRH